MLVTDRQYYIEPALKEKFDLCIDRYNQNNDNLFIVDGATGLGKTTATIGWAYYIAQQIGKPFSVDNVFFDANKMMDFASSTEGQVIIFDEAATIGMSTDWQNKIQKKLIKILLMARKKRHFWFFIIPYFDKLNETIVRRAIGLLHVYSPDHLEKGSFVYIKEENKNFIYYKLKKEPGNNTWYRTNYAFMGRFPKNGFVIDEAEYEKRKDQAIRDIFNDDNNDKETSRWKDRYNRLRDVVVNNPKLKLRETVLELEKEFNKATIYDWKKIADANLDRMNEEVNHESAL